MSFDQPASNSNVCNKRRRFAPNTLPIVSTPDDGLDPVLLEIFDKSPSQQEIEASLLQVGMRIRKSVADGYQTPGRRAFTPRPFMNYAKLSPETLSALSTADSNSAGAVKSAGTSLSTATFCGINLAMMSHFCSTPPIEEQKLWSYSTSSKRRQHFDEDDDSDDSQEFMPRTPQLEFADAGMAIPQDYFNINPESMVDFSEPEQAFIPRANVHNRRMAQPKARLRTVVEQQNVAPANPFAQLNQTSSYFGGHQRMRSCGMEAMDFGEAPFLQPRQDVDMDWS